MIYSIYQLIIYPIELMLEIAFSVLYELRHDVGLSIIGVSIVVNFLMLPLYNRADKISEEERSRYDGMAADIAHIRKTFTGDERFMMLQTYYRKQSYHPLNSLRSSLPLLLQIPFFIAAYHFLSHLTLLNHMSFLWIKNLSAPDGIIVIPAVGVDVLPQMIVYPGFNINVLPILMTLINVISTLIYTKGSPLKEKVQLYVMAGIFLVLLYNSPSGLVIYWTMNNIFSLMKNIVLGIRKKFAMYKVSVVKEQSKTEETPREIHGMFIMGILLLTLILGVVIPSSVIVSSPDEFVTVAAYKNPLQYVLHALLIAAGFLMIWLPVFYYLGSYKAKRVICTLLWVCSGVSLIDFLGFGKVDIYLNSKLKYDTVPEISTQRIILNLVIVIIVSAAMLFITVKRKKAVKMIYGILISSVLLLSAVNIIQTGMKLSAMPYLKKEGKSYEGFTLSKNGKNVIVIMLDRAIGTYMPFIMAERPELKEKYSGFIYYPNTISFGGRTMTGSPALFGGYDYTPEGMEARPEVRLVDKHEEALKLMPMLFSENGYRSTVYDAPLGGYQWTSDLSLYDDCPGVKAYSLKDCFSDPELMFAVDKYRYRSFFMYSIYKSVPLLIQGYVYDNGKYHYPDNQAQINSEFEGPYAILQNLDVLTEIEDSAQNTFMMMNNDAPHSISELQLPDYIPSAVLNNRGLETGYRVDEEGNVLEIDDCYLYHVNISPLIELGKWLDYLKENDVYDNTRIVIVADHGYHVGQFENLIQDDGSDMQSVIPLLMYKDFGAKEYTVSNEFMTNGDTPVLAMNGLIDDPVNPFTGNRIDSHEKRAHDQRVIVVDIEENTPQNSADNPSFVCPGQVWYTIHDNVYDKSNWKRISVDGSGEE